MSTVLACPDLACLATSRGNLGRPTFRAGQTNEITNTQEYFEYWCVSYPAQARRTQYKQSKISLRTSKGDTPAWCPDKKIRLRLGAGLGFLKTFLCTYLDSRLRLSHDMHGITCFHPQSAPLKNVGEPHLIDCSPKNYHVGSARAHHSTTVLVCFIFKQFRIYLVPTAYFRYQETKWPIHPSASQMGARSVRIYSSQHPAVEALAACCKITSGSWPPGPVRTYITAAAGQHHISSSKASSGPDRHCSARLYTDEYEGKSSASDLMPSKAASILRLKNERKKLRHGILFPCLFCATFKPVLDSVERNHVDWKIQTPNRLTWMQCPINNEQKGAQCRYALRSQIPLSKSILWPKSWRWLLIILQFFAFIPIFHVWLNYVHRRNNT